MHVNILVVFLDLYIYITDMPLKSIKLINDLTLENFLIDL